MSTEQNTYGEFIGKRADALLGQITIDKSFFIQNDVKRGLRNADGTGVMAGVTRIGSTQGYFMRDGEKTAMEGKLYYRGIDVADIVDGFLKDGRPGFEETAFLLVLGKLPNTAELETFRGMLEEFRELPKGFTEDMILPAPSVNIMNKMSRCVLALYSYDETPETDERDLNRELTKALRLLACGPIIAAHTYAAKRHYFDGEGLYLHRSQPGYSMAENFLHSVRRDNSFTAEEARLLDLCMVLHAEHGGGNNSAFACRVLTSSGTDIYSAISAAIGSLKGPRHGGANEKVIDMFSHIKKDVKNWTNEDEVADYLDKILRKEAAAGDGLIYGMGHAVYTVSDPRAIMLKELARSLAEKKGMEDEFGLIETVEKLAPYALGRAKGTRKAEICANVDMYSGLVYEMLGIPQELFTPLFAVARMAGWCAHRLEEAWGGGRIIRPAYKAIALDEDYVPLGDRA
ncbi:MAG: citrate synthase [Oscillospiraceae bacterium]|jgi:citrate synthase|nr:citrate synthase [Oscillospiraceae bacterium]